MAGLSLSCDGETEDASLSRQAGGVSLVTFKDGQVVDCLGHGQGDVTKSEP